MTFAQGHLRDIAIFTDICLIDIEIAYVGYQVNHSGADARRRIFAHNSKFIRLGDDDFT
jgi:hypothetical protein